MTLTKNGLVKRISKETGLNKIQAFEVVQKTLNYITESLARGDKVELRNFGVFEVKTRKAKMGRNPKKPETEVPIPARSMVKFKAGKEMGAEVLKLTPKLKKKAPWLSECLWMKSEIISSHPRSRPWQLWLL